MTETTEGRDPEHPEEQERATAVTGGGAVSAAPRRAAPKRQGSGFRLAFFFLLPALLFLGALVVYPIFFTVFRSLFDIRGDTFIGLQNYQRMLTSPSTLTSIKNNAIWVVFAPSIVTALGLIFAVLTERIKWSTAFKVAVFMPMAISFLAAGVIFRLVYEREPDRGLANATLSKVVHIFRSPGLYPGGRPSQEDLLRPDDGGFASNPIFTPGDIAALGLIGIRPALVPASATVAAPTRAAPGAISGVVWLDFSPLGGERGVIDVDERGLPGVEVQALEAGRVVASATTDDAGVFVLEGLGEGRNYNLRLSEKTFRPPFGGVQWLGPTLVTPAVIGSYVWIWAGFAMVVIGAGLAAIPRDVLEAARVDGAGEWQVFRRVTVPLLMPVLLVVLITLVINVLKVFDLVLIIPPGSVQADANVIALEMWRVSFGGARDQGLGSALAVFLFVLVFPAMLFNLRRFKAEQT